MKQGKEIRRIYLVDDEPMVLRALKRVLRQEGFEIHAFGSAREALEQLEHSQPDCLVSDYYMPEMDGIDFLAQVHQKYPDVFRVMLTGGYLDDRVRQAMKNGDIHLLIRKPWRTEDIRRLLQAVVQGEKGVIEQEKHLLDANGKPAEVHDQRDLDRLEDKTRPTVLVVDDDDSFLELMDAWLEQLGFSLLTARQAEPVLEIIREREPNAVIVDLILPGTDGLELIGAIRDLHPVLPLLAITGGRQHDLGLEAFRRGATAFLHKPFELETLEATLRRCLNSARLSFAGESSLELRTLLEIQHAIASRLPPQRLLQLMLQQLLRYSGADSASVLLLNPDGRSMRLAASYGLKEDQLPAGDIALDAGVAGWVIRNNEPQVIIGQPDDDPRMTPHRHNPASMGLILPLRGGQAVQGALCLTRYQSTEPFSRGVVDLGLLVGSEVARAIEKHQEEERRQTLERNLMQRDKLVTIGELASGVAHEINNPLGYVNSNLSTLKSYLDELLPLLQQLCSPDGPPPSAELGEAAAGLDLAGLLEDIPACLAETREGVERVMRIVADLKMMSRNDTDVKEMVSVNEILEGAIGILWNQIKYRAELVRQLDDLPPYPCYPNQLGQVFLNLLHNAVQAIPHHGTITVRSRRLPDSLVVEIEDDGEGIPPEVRDRLFEPFFTTKPRGVGTGLGLSIARKIIVRHEGRIEVESEPGRGTLFRVILPWPAPGQRVVDDDLG